MFIEDEQNGLNEEQIRDFIFHSFKERKLKKVLIIPPDITRINSGAGLITAIYYELLSNAQVDILPALGTHTPMTRQEQIEFFGANIPGCRFLTHNWRDGVEKIGQIPRDFIYNVSEGLMDEAIDVEISHYLLDPSYDLILSIGQVVPHEVVGMANYTKNIVVGCGGSNFINRSHMLGAFYGLERIMGTDYSPVRKVFDYAQEHFISKLPVEYVLTVTATECSNTKILGLFIDKSREGFNLAVKLSQKHNLSLLERPLKVCVVWLNAKEYRSAWLGNKAIYRTRMALEDGAKLIILAPGVCRFGEDDENDRIIRKFGYIGRENIIRLCKSEIDLKNNLSAAAHLIHGSSDGRFTVTYAAPHLTKNEVESVGFKYMFFDEAMNLYYNELISGGYNKTLSGDEYYYIDDPSAGLWISGTTLTI